MRVKRKLPGHRGDILRAPRCVQALVEAGAQVDMQTKSECGKNVGAVALHYAAQQDQQQVVNYLIRQRASVNKQDARGCTPLHYAAVLAPTLYLLALFLLQITLSIALAFLPPLFKQ